MPACRRSPTSRSPTWPTTLAPSGRGRCSSASRASVGWARLRSAGGRAGRGGSGRRAPAGPRRARGPRPRRARGDGARGGALQRRPDRAAGRRRGHRHERQDHDGVPGARAARGRGAPTGLLGTVKSIVGGAEREVKRTTPEAIDLQREFRDMVDGGDVACAMEVSSHALELRRADAIHWDVAIFTNLTQDHLDFHPTMEDYFVAKRRLFDAGPPGRGGQRRRQLRPAAGRRPGDRDDRGARARGRLPRP